VHVWSRVARPPLQQPVCELARESTSAAGDVTTRCDAMRYGAPRGKGTVGVRPVGRVLVRAMRVGACGVASRWWCGAVDRVIVGSQLS
jgi:hypothetical protein